MRLPNFGDPKIKQEIATNHYLRAFSIFENHKLHRIKDRNKISHNRIKSFDAKSALSEKKG